MTHLIICFSPQTVVMRRTLPHQPQSGWRSAGCSSFNPLPSGPGQGQDRVEALLRGVVDLAFVRADRGPLYTSIFPREPRGRRRRSQLSGWITLNQCGLWLIFFIYGPNLASFLFIFVLFSFQIQFQRYKLKKSIDGVLGIRTRGRRIVGTDKTAELWRPPLYLFLRIINIEPRIEQPFNFSHGHN